MCDTNQISKHFRKPFFIKGQKSRLFKTKVFFVQKKSGKDKKTGDAKVDKKKLQKPSQPEGRKNGTRKMCSSPPQKREKQNKENRGKNGEKKKEDEKNEE